MIDFIPLHVYALVVNTAILVTVVLTVFLVSLHPHAVVERPGVKNSLLVFLGSALFSILCVLVGLRPISYAFGDMGTYYKHFLEYAHGVSPAGPDPFFDRLMWLFAQFNVPTLFFLFCALVYLIPLRSATKRLFGSYWTLGFLFIIANVSFYGFAVNGIRNGMAMSMFILAITMKNWRAWILMALAIGFHASLMLPVAAYVATKRYFNIRWALRFWVGCLFISLFIPGVAEFITGLMPVDDRLEQYVALGDTVSEQFSSTGFRWDFVIYSAFPIAIGLLFSWKGKQSDNFYRRLFSTYILVNAVWLLLMRIPFSNRFAYLSWGFMGLVCAYPLIKWQIFKQQQLVFSVLLVILSGFSYMYQL